MDLQRIETRVCSIVSSVSMSTDMTDGMSTLIASSFSHISHLIRKQILFVAPTKQCLTVPHHFPSYHSGSTQ